MSRTKVNTKTQPKDFFKRVPQSEKKVLFQKVVKQKVTLVVKGDFEDLITLSPFRIVGDNILYCAVELEDSPLEEGQSLIVNFALASERYFFISKVSFENEVPYLKIDTDLFHLQRRQNARFDVPDEYDAYLNIIELNGKSVFIESRIQDIGAGGCQIFIKSLNPVFNVEDRMIAVLHLGHRRPLTFQINVRYAKLEASGQLLGIQYLQRDSVMENKLLSMMTDFQRELYLKYG